MEISQELFEYYCPVATSPDTAIFDMVRNELSASLGLLASIMGDAYAKLPNAPQAGSDDQLESAACSFAINRAFLKAIPHLDLVLTETGFGVVSNQNVAPASRERVERLTEEVRNKAEDAEDALIDALAKDEDWRETAVSKRYFSSVIYKGEQLRTMGYHDAHRRDLENFRPKIYEAERIIMGKVGVDQYDEFLDYARTPENHDEIWDTAIRKIMGIIAMHLSDMREKATRRLNNFVTWMEMDEQEEAFPTYLNSTAYKANHYERYENKKGDTCFFFG